MSLSHPSRYEGGRPTTYAWERRSWLVIDGDVINEGDFFVAEKAKYIFKEHVINHDTGRQWVTAFKAEKSGLGGYYSFDPQKVSLNRRKANKK